MATEFVQIDTVRNRIMAEPPLRGVRDDGASNVISFQNGTTQTSAPAGTAVVNVAEAPAEAVLQWLLQQVQPKPGLGVVNHGLRARGIVVDIYRKHPDEPEETLELLVKIEQGYYVLRPDDAEIVPNQ